MAPRDSAERHLNRIGTGELDFIERHNLWSEEQRAGAARVLQELHDLEVETVRVSFADLHGLLRGKTLTVGAFEAALRNGLDCSTGPYFFDTGLDLVGDPFTPGGGLGIDELTGAGDFVLVPDPSTFRLLPWTEGITGWLLGDEYFKSGEPVPLSGRHLLRRLLTELDGRGLGYVAGVEIEWYLTRLLDPRDSSVGGFGSPGEPPLVAPVNPGYQFNSEQYADLLEPLLSTLRRTVQALGLPLRTTEHESGPGQLEFTFDPQPGLQAADGVLLFRNAVKQVCARSGYHATFMCRPALEGFDASGWHLHQSLFRLDGANAFASQDPGQLVSPLARAFIGGLLAHAGAASVFSTPTINGYARAASGYMLAPDRACWSVENRGTFIRVIGQPGDPATHLENRAGEPAANPYLYMASQLIAGLDGIERGLDPGPARLDPHSDEAPRLPASLAEALSALRDDAVFRERAGATLLEHLLLVKEHELGRYERWLAQLDQESPALPGGISDWEQREYFRVF